MKFEWELIYKSIDKITETWRAKIVGGWLVKDFNCIYTDDVTGSSETVDTIIVHHGARRYAIAESMIFIADLNHLWEVDQLCTDAK